MADGIFVIRGDLEGEEGELLEMRQAQYVNEDLLQSLLERYPDLLPGGQINPEAPRRWLLVRREQPVPDMLDGSSRWSLDHLFIDQDGTPTLVEVKRSTDTRIRREVIGQLLDYAANAVSYWPVDALRAEFEARHPDPGAAIADALGPDVDVDTLWKNVGHHLEEGTIRLIFLADEIPRELRRVVEFLSDQMRAEVLAVEVSQYAAEGASDIRTMVARVYGVKTAPVKPPPIAWTPTAFFEAVDKTAPATATCARALLDWATDSRLGVLWGTGAKVGSFNVFASQRGHYLFSVRTDGSIEIGFGYLAKHPAFQAEEPRRALAARLRGVPLDVSDDQIARYPTFKLSQLAADDARQRFIEAMDWAVRLIRASQE